MKQVKSDWLEAEFVAPARVAILQATNYQVQTSASYFSCQ